MNGLPRPHDGSEKHVEFACFVYLLFVCLFVGMLACLFVFLFVCFLVFSFACLFVCLQTTRQTNKQTNKQTNYKLYAATTSQLLWLVLQEALEAKAASPCVARPNLVLRVAIHPTTST
jgi:hypothetical protein